MTYTTININHRCIDSVHVFTSPDVKGLYVAGEDLLQCYEGLPEIVAILLQFNHGIQNAQIIHADSVKDSERKIKGMSEIPLAARTQTTLIAQA